MSLSLAVAGGAYGGLNGYWVSPRDMHTHTYMLGPCQPYRTNADILL